MSLLDLLDDNCLEMITEFAFPRDFEGMSCELADPLKAPLRSICTRMRAITPLRCHATKPREPMTGPRLVENMMLCGAIMGCKHICAIALRLGAAQMQNAMQVALMTNQHGICNALRDHCIKTGTFATIDLGELIEHAAFTNRLDICDVILSWDGSNPELYNKMLRSGVLRGSRAICQHTRIASKKYGVQLDNKMVFFAAALYHHFDICILAHDWIVEDHTVVREDIVAFAETFGNAEFTAIAHTWRN